MYAKFLCGFLSKGKPWSNPSFWKLGLTIVLHKGQPNPSNSRHVCYVFSCMVNSGIWNEMASAMSKSKLRFPNVLLNKTKGLLKKTYWCFCYLLHTSKIIITRLLNQEWGLLQKPCLVFSPQKMVLHLFFFLPFSLLSSFLLCVSFSSSFLWLSPSHFRSFCGNEAVTLFGYS